MRKPNSAKELLYSYRFGTAEFDEARFELRVGGLVVDVQPKPLQLLAALLRTPGEVLSKHELFDDLWDARATGDAVLANAASKLRSALGAGNAEAIVTVPRQGYRLDGAVERIAAGRRVESRLELTAGNPVPGRTNYQLVRCLSTSSRHETWLACHPKTGDRRVFKFAVDGEQLADLKREVSVVRVLQDGLADRDCLVALLDWNFEAPPYWIETAYAGVSLDQWASEWVDGDTRLSHLTRDARLQVFQQIADAVGAANDAGVIHKDLKPGNVLLDRRGDSWVVRLTDFGSARLLDPQILDELNITRLGLTVGSLDNSDSGTPFYVAPELFDGQAPTARSDVFALGVILHQLLAGDLKKPMVPGWEREIGDALLVADIARATDADPQRRHGSAAELAAQLRALAQRRERQTLDAAADERAREMQAALARARARRPWIVLTMLALTLGGVAAFLLYLKQRHVTESLQREYRISKALNALLRDDLVGAANPSLSGRADISVADALRAIAPRIDTRFDARDAAVRASLHEAMQGALSELSRSSDAVDAGRRAVAALQALSPPEPGRLQEVRLRLALDLVQLSKLDEAASVITGIERDAGPVSAQAAGFRARLLYVKSWLTSGDFSLQQATEYLEEARRLLGTKTEAEVPWRDKIIFGLADSYSMLDRNAEAESVYRELYSEQVKRLGERHARPLYTLVGLANSVMAQNRHAEAQTLLESAIQGLEATLGAKHRMTLTARDLLAMLHFREHQYAQAAAEWEPVHAGFVELLGESSYTITIATNRALALQAAGHPAEASLLLRHELAGIRKLVAEDSPQAQQIRYALADSLLDLGQPRDVETLLRGLSPEALNLAQIEPDWAAQLDFQRGRLALIEHDLVNARRLLGNAAQSLAPGQRISRERAMELMRKAGPVARRSAER